MSSGGFLTIHSGGVGISATLSGNAATASTFGDEFVRSGGRTSRTVINSGGVEIVSAGGLAVSTIVNSAGVGTGGLILSGGIASGSIVNSGGEEVVLSGGHDIGGTISRGGDLFVKSGGVASRTAVIGLEIVSSGGFALANIIQGVGAIGGGGSGLGVSGFASGTVLKNGGQEGVFSGGTDISAAVSSGGGLFIHSGGIASGATVKAGGLAVVESGSGGAVVVGNGLVDVLSGGSANVRFLSNGSGGLEIADTDTNPSAFTGTVSGFGGVNHSNHKQFIDLVSVISAGLITSSYVSANAANTSGTLFVSSGGVEVAAITMVGHYSAGNFHITAGSGGTVEIVDPAVVNGGSVEPGPLQSFPRHGIDLPDIAFGAQTTLAYAANAAGPGGTLTMSDGRHAAAIALLGNYMAGSFVTAADGHGGTLVMEAQTGQQPLLTHPPHQ